MKKHCYTLVGVMVLMTIFNVSTSTAQSSSQRFTAMIPFAFHTGAQTLPAGEYEITIINPSSDQRVLRIRGVRQDGSAMLQTHSVKARSNNDAKLVFRRYGEHYFLAQAWTGADNIGMETATSAAEKAFRNEYTAIERSTESIRLARGQ